MKKIGLFLLVVLLGAMAPSHIVWAEDAEGFRGIEWGTDIHELKDVQPVGGKSQSGEQLFVRNNENMTLGGAQLFSVTYFFWQDKFFTAEVETKGEENYAALKDAAFAKFGPGIQTNRFTKDYIWKPSVTLKMLNFNEINKKGILWMGSKEIIDQQRADKAKKAKEGAASGF